MFPYQLLLVVSQIVSAFTHLTTYHNTKRNEQHHHHQATDRGQHLFLRVIPFRDDSKESKYHR